MLVPSSPKKLKVVFFGAPGEYAQRTLEAVAAVHQVVAVVKSAPRGSRDKTLGWGQKGIEVLYGLFGQPSLWLYARSRRLPYFYCSKSSLPQCPSFLRGVKADIGCIASFDLLFPKTVIHSLPLGIINFHPSLLPRHRGPFVWFWIYHQMDPVGGAIIHYIDSGEDTGEILMQGSFPIPLGMPPRELVKTSISLGARLMVSALDQVAAGTAVPVPQSHLPCPHRARRIKPGQDLFNWQDWSLAHCFHFLQAVWYWTNSFEANFGFWGIIPWQAVRFREMAGIPRPGRISLDRQGVYFVHPQGKIYLRPSPPTTSFLLAAAAILLFIYLAFQV